MKVLMRMEQPSPSDLETMTQSTAPASHASASIEHQFTRCALCFSELIVSKLGVAGVCLECQAPICAKCWKILGKRHCFRHAPAEGPNDQAAARIPAGRAVTPAMNTVQLTGASAPHSSPLSAVAATEVPHVNRETAPITADGEENSHNRSGASDDQVSDVSGRAAEVQTHQGGTGSSSAVSSSQACLAERTFVRLVEDALQDVTEVRDPLRGVTLRVRDWRRVRRPADALSGSWSGAGGAKAIGKPAASCPRGNAVRFDLRQRNLLGRLRGGAVVEVRNLTRVEQYAAAGCDDQPISRQELESFLNDAARRAARRGVAPAHTRQPDWLDKGSRGVRDRRKSSLVPRSAGECDPV